MVQTPTALGHAALAYAARGWPVFPCQGKIPRTPHGFQDATTDGTQIRQWWARWLDATIGVPTGVASGLVVLDIDPRHGGEESLATLIAAHGPLPETVESRTGGGGRHLFFQHPGGYVPNSSGRLGPGLDIRGDGGYVIVPPSLHASGQRYEWTRHPERSR